MTNGRERMREIRRESLERAGFSIQFKGLDLALDEAMSTYAAEAVRAEREKWPTTIIVPSSQLQS